MRRRSKNGFSFIELLVALAIFSVGILGIISLQGISLMATDFGGNMTVARILASDQLDRLQTLAMSSSSLDICGTPYCHKDIGAGSDGTVRATLGYTGAVDVNGRFQREWDVQDLSPATSMARVISVRVYWTDIGKTGVSSAGARTFNRKIEMTSIKVQ
jgi:type IV pilus assembly protein PilV